MTSIVETYAQQSIASVPHVGAVYVEPGTSLDLKGNSFLIDGNDTNPDGSPGPNPAEYGIATEEAATAGDNANALVAQINASRYDQVIGQGANPSIGEVSDNVDIDQIFNSFYAIRDQDFSAGTYSNVTWGDSSNYMVTHISGDAHFTGNGTGAGVLLVDGELHVSGQFEWQGLVVVRGDMRQTGGGSGVHTWGTVLVSSLVTVVDEVTGNADLKYSSAALDQVNAMLSGSASYSVLYWDIIQ